MDTPIFIALLEFGEKKGLDGTDLNQAWHWGEEQGFIPAPESEGHISAKSLFRNLFFECFDRNSNTTEAVWVLKNEYYFRLLEYRELSEARQASMSANRNALAAISISVIAIVVSLGIGLYQSMNPISIESKQFSSFVDQIDHLSKESIDASAVASSDLKSQLILLQKSLDNIHAAINKMSVELESSDKSMQPTAAQPAD